MFRNWGRIWALVGLLSCGIDPPQASADRPENLLFSSIRREEGLGATQVNAIAQTKLWSVWFGTDKGLSRWDGNEFQEVLREEVASVSNLCVDGRNWLWVGTKGGGLYRLNALYHQESMGATYLMGPGADTLVDNTVTCIVDEPVSERVWVATNLGLHRIETPGDHQFMLQRVLLTGNPVSEGRSKPNKETILALLPLGQSGELWLGTHGGELLLLDPRSSEGTPLEKEDFGVAVTCLAAQGSNSDAILVGTRGDGVFLYDPDTRKKTPLTGLPSPDVTSLAVDQEGVIWAGTRGGIGQLKPGDSRFDAYRHDPTNHRSLVADDVRCVVTSPVRRNRLNESANQDLWIGTSLGVSFCELRRRRFDHFQPVPGDSNGLKSRTVSGFSASGGDSQVWVCGDRGIELFDLTTGQVMGRYGKEENGLSAQRVTAALHDRRSRLWVGTEDGGLNRLDSRLAEGTSGFHTYNAGSGHPFFEQPITQIMEDRSGTVWIGTHGDGVLRYNSASDAFDQLHDRQGRSLGDVSALCEDLEGNVWIGTSGNGAYKVPVGGGPVVAYPAKNDKSGNHLNSGRITMIHASNDGLLWFATDGGGLNRLDPVTGKFWAFTEESPDMNSFRIMPSRRVLSVVTDSFGAVWAATDRGIVMMPDAGNSTATRFFSPVDGLQYRPFSEGAAFRCGTGELLFGGEQGFNVITPGQLPDARQAATPVLTGLELNDERLEPGPGGILESALKMTEAIELNHDQRGRMAILFATIDFSSLVRTEFRYQLVNHDDDWVEAGGKRRAPYPPLAPGQYLFKVESTLDGKTWTPSAPLTILVHPPWYQTVWAKWGFVLGGVVLFWGLLRSYTTRLTLRRERMQLEMNKVEAALSRGLQESMLLDADADGVRGGGADEESDFNTQTLAKRLFEAPLRQLAVTLSAGRCQLWMLDESGALTSGGAYVEGGARPVALPDPGSDDQWFKQVLNSDEAVAYPDPDSWESEMDPISGVKSFLAVRSAYLEQPNGLILLDEVKPSRKWEDDERVLAGTVADLIGLAIAQLKLAQKERSHRRELIEAKQSADLANSAKSEFLAKMTHELRTPLNAILGFCQLLCRDTSTTESQRDTLNIINRSGEHLLDLINDVLEMSKIEAGQTEVRRDRFEVERLIRSVHEMLQLKAGEKGIELNLTVESTLPREAFSDRSKIRQILLNLLGNAVKFTEEGHVSLTVRSEAGKADELKLHFAIEDTGRGIEAHELPTLFQKFRQTESGKLSHQGTGLGLAISKHFIELLGGKIEVRSVYGKGTVFEFFVVCEPAVDRSVPNPEAEAGRVLGIADGQPIPKILIVEDQPVNRVLLKRLLASVGFEIIEAENGKIAADNWQKWKPDLIFMDQDMPIMNGNEATRSIVASAGGASNAPPIVALTAYALEDTKRAAIDAGCRGFLTKPFKNSEIFALIANELGLRYVFSGEDQSAEEPEVTLPS